MPAPTYTEIHHVIPQAWQVFWQPPQPWPNAGPSPDRRNVATGAPVELWDARTVAICRTGHGNVHHWIVAMTRRAAAWPNATLGQLEHDTRLACRAAGEYVGGADYIVACQALERWTAAGGSVAALVAAKLWGEI